MHRAPLWAALLVMASALGSPLLHVNPWLSACDLAQDSMSDLRAGSCSTHGDLFSGPGPPPDTHQRRHDNHTQCLLPTHHDRLRDAHGRELCDAGLADTDVLTRLSQLRLRHCCEHSVLSVLAHAHRRQLLQGGTGCRRLLHDVMQVDAQAATISCHFADVLRRYDCTQPYSIVYRCRDCKEAYRRWVCSSLLPVLEDEGRRRVRPCRSVCQTVEQRCPYLLPGDRAPAHPTQYAGEPTFLCLDPNIPETGVQKLKSAHGDERCCYTYCGTPGRPCVRCPAPDAASNASVLPQTVSCPPSIAPPASECRLKATNAAPANTHSQTRLAVCWTAVQLVYSSLQTITHIIHCSLLCVRHLRTSLAAHRHPA